MIVQRILHTAEKYPEKQAVVYGPRSITYAELSKEIRSRAGAYQQQITSSKVILTQVNSLENLLDLLALMAIGKASIMASTQLQTEQMQGLLEREGVVLLPERDLQISPLSDIQSVTLTDRFLGVLTSGTESLPKVIWKDYQSWVTAFPHQSAVFGITAEDRLFVLDALSYSANLNSVLHMLWLGGSVVMTSLKSAASWPRQMQDQQVSSVFMVPSHYRLWVRKTLSLPGIKSLVSAGEKLEASLAEMLLECFPEALLTEYYGAAELGHISYQQNQDIIQHGYAVGQAFPGVKIKIVDQRIWVESDYVSPDYRGVNTVFDLGLIEDGRLILMGRSGRMFNRRGLNIFAEEIENSAKLMPFVTEVAVIGLLREDLSHDIYLVFRATYPGDVQTNYAQQLKTHLLHSLPSFKQPKRILQLRNLPRKDNGKIDYQAVARIFSEEDSPVSVELNIRN